MAKILIVDDENNIRLMMRLALRADGHEVSAASDGIEALDLFGAGGVFDLVLLDQRMPNMEGIEVLRAMKERDAGAKIIMATAFGTVDVAREAMRAGAGGFLRKPFTIEVLRAAVGSVLAGDTVSGAKSDGDEGGDEGEEPAFNLAASSFSAVSVNGFRLESVGDERSIARHEFQIHAPGTAPRRITVEMPPFFIELVKAQSDRENLQNDADFWRWLSEESLANYLWQNSAPPPGETLVLDELTSNLRRWMDAVLV